MEEYQFTIDVTKLLNVLERIASAIEKQTDKLSEIDWTIGQISDHLEISPKGKAEAEGLNITDILSFCDNRDQIDSIRQEVFVGWTAINRRLADLYQRRKDKEAE